MASLNNLRIAIIGAGPMGMSCAYELKQQGFKNVVMLEAAQAAGGTWHTHSYPGLACDVWAHSYTFSWARNPNWSASFVERAEIEAYLQKAAKDAGLHEWIQFNKRVERMEYQNDGTWVVTAADGSQEQFGAVISCVGNQFTPLMPDVKGLDTFQGDSWHSTHWNHDVDLKGKKIAVVGSAAAAVQIVPELAKVASELTVLQRTANWIMPRNRKVYSNFQRRLFNSFPFLNELLIKGQGFLMNLVGAATTLGHKRMDQFENVAKKYIEKSFDDEAMREAVTPKTRYGCKRPLVSDDFYPALNRDNVTLIADGAQAVNQTGLVTSGGVQIDVDVIVYCTGYKVMDFDRIEIIGVDGVNLAERLLALPEAYKGIAVPGFPNYFFGIGPNGVALTVSYFRSAELNAKAIVRVLKEKQQLGVKAVDVKPELHRAYNDRLLGEFPKYSWGASNCNSYYQTRTGHVPFLFPGDFKAFAKEREELSLEEFVALP